MDHNPKATKCYLVEARRASVWERLSQRLLLFVPLCHVYVNYLGRSARNFQTPRSELIPTPPPPSGSKLISANPLDMLEVN